MKRFGQIIKVKSEKLAEYIELHQAVWPDVLSKIQECHIRNYTIFYRDGYLYSYYEYIGLDYKSDMRRMASDPKTQEWWKLTDPCQQPIETAAAGERWSPMREVFHCD